MTDAVMREADRHVVKNAILLVNPLLERDSNGIYRDTRVAQRMDVDTRPHLYHATRVYLQCIPSHLSAEPIVNRVAGHYTPTDIVWWAHAFYKLAKEAAQTSMYTHLSHVCIDDLARTCLIGDALLAAVPWGDGSGYGIYDMEDACLSVAKVIGDFAASDELSIGAHYALAYSSSSMTLDVPPDTSVIVAKEPEEKPLPSELFQRKAYDLEQDAIHMYKLMQSAYHAVIAAYTPFSTVVPNVEMGGRVVPETLAMPDSPFINPHGEWTLPMQQLLAFINNGLGVRPIAGQPLSQPNAQTVYCTPSCATDPETGLVPFQLVYLAHLREDCERRRARYAATVQQTLDKLHAFVDDYRRKNDDAVQSAMKSVKNPLYRMAVCTMRLPVIAKSLRARTERLVRAIQAIRLDHHALNRAAASLYQCMLVCHRFQTPTTAVSPVALMQNPSSFNTYTLPSNPTLEHHPCEMALAPLVPLVQKRIQDATASPAAAAEAAAAEQDLPD
jgi:hypothetical protein